MAAVRHVLIADPDAAARQRLVTIVEEAARELELELAIDQASDGNQALAAIEAQSPMLFLGEVLLAEISGLALLRRLRDKHERAALPLFIFVTSMARESDRYWGLRNGAHAYIIKPYDDALLRARLRQVLQAGREAAPDRLGPI